MNAISRKDFLKAGAALPLALQSLDLRANAKPKLATPPKRIIFVCSCLGFYKPYFFPKKRGDLKTSDYLKDMKAEVKSEMTKNADLAKMKNKLAERVVQEDFFECYG